MENHSNTILYNFVDYYFSERSYSIHSINKLASIIDTTPAKTKKLISYFHRANFLYSHNKSFYILKSFQSMNKKFDKIVDDKYITFKSDFWEIKFNIFELNLIEPNFNIDCSFTINDVFYFMYLFAINFHIFLQKEFYLDENNILWYEKVCYYLHSEDCLYCWKYSQGTDKLKLFNN